MIIAQDKDTRQVIKFIPRTLYAGTATALFTDKTTKEQFAYTVTTIVDRYYIYFDHALPDLVEGHTYDFIISNPTPAELYEGLVLCTNQISDGGTEYKPNDGIFQKRTTTNDYIILE